VPLNIQTSFGASIEPFMPKVSIGLPVFNGEKSLHEVLDALLKQSMPYFELIISDNNSTDATESICRDYAKRDPRVKYFRQRSDIGMYANFRFVFDQANAPYFMWSACDDTRSYDFLEKNLVFLEKNQDYVASSSPNGMVTQDGSISEMFTFALNGSVEARFMGFLDNCWKSHGIFYALIRTDVLKGCDAIGKTFLGADWAVNLYVASRGKINRTAQGAMISGARGISSERNSWRAFRAQSFEWALPFFHFSLYALQLSRNFKVWWRVVLAFRLLMLNLDSAYHQIYAEAYEFYRTHVKSRYADDLQVR